MQNQLGFDTCEFNNGVSNILENDYGDFMRSANIRLNRLKEELCVLKDANIDLKLSEMQTYLQFKPNWDIESTRQKLAEDIKYLDEVLAGHFQDWESVAPTS